MPSEPRKSKLHALIFVVLILALALLRFSPSFPIQETDAQTTDIWPTFHHDNVRTGYTSSAGPETSQILWRTPTGGWVVSSPTVADGKVFVGSDDGYIYALDENSGAVLWKQTTGGRVYSSPAVANGKVFVGSWNGWIYRLDENTGASRRLNKTGGPLTSSPAVADGKVFMGSWDSCIYSLNQDDGIIIWKYQTGGRIQSSPALHNGRLFIGSNDRKVYCLDANSGGSIWQYQTGGPIASSPAVADGKLFVGSNDHRIYCLDEATGALIWSYQTAEVLMSSPAVANGRVFIGSNDGKIYSLDEASGNLVWSYTTGAMVSSSPAVSDGKVFVGSNDNCLYCLGMAGELIWRYQTGYWIQSSPAIANGRLFVGSNDGYIYAFGLGGTPRFTISIYPSYQFVNIGGSTSFYVTATSFGGFSAPVFLAVSGLPEGAAYAFNPQPLPVLSDRSTEANLTIYASTSITGAFNLTITGIGDSLTDSCNAELLVYTGPQPDFSISASPESLTMLQGESASSTINVTSINAFNMEVSFSTSSVPIGVAISGPAPVSPLPDEWATSTLTLTAETSANPGYYELTITALSGPLNHTITLILNIVAVSEGGLIFNVIREGVQYHVQISSNSHISNFIYDEERLLINFTVVGSTGTQGFCNVTTPKALISGLPVVFFDNYEIASTYTENATYYFIYFTFIHSAHDVIVGGSYTIPEFSKEIPPVILLLAIVLATISLKRRNK